MRSSFTFPDMQAHLEQEGSLITGPGFLAKAPRSATPRLRAPAAHFLKSERARKNIALRVCFFGRRPGK